MQTNSSKSMLIKNLMEKIHLSSNSEEELFREDLKLVKIKTLNQKIRINKKERNLKKMKIISKIDKICLCLLKVHLI